MAEEGLFNKALTTLGDLLPARLRVPFTSGIVLVGGAGAVILFFLRLEWNDILKTWQFLFVLTFLFLSWSIILIRRRARIPWRRWVLWSVAAVLWLAVVVSGSAAIRRSRFQYNQGGFFESRSLRPSPAAGHNSFEWTMEVVGDNLSKGHVIVELQPVGDCRDDNVTAFYPEKNENTHQPTVWDTSLLGQPHSVWTIDGFHDGDEQRFILESPESVASRICFKPTVTVQTK